MDDEEDGEDENDDDDCKYMYTFSFYHYFKCNLLQFFLVAPPPVVKKRKLGKNPTVDTSFLPDRDREVRSNCQYF